jgi:flagellar protein FlaG
MTIESIKAIQADLVRVGNSGKGSAATAQTPLKKSLETVQPQKPLQEEPRSTDDIKKDIATINAHMKSMNRSLRFSIDDKSKEVVVKVVDENTGDVLMQIPSEEVLKLRERLDEMSGLLVEKQV